MEKKKQRSWKQILAMAFTFAMVMVFAGITGKVDANAYETKYCKVTVKVTDKETGAEIPGAQVIFTDYYSPYGVIEVTQNEDGTYNLPYEDDGWGLYYRYYATATGYKSSLGSSGKGTSTGDVQCAELTLPAIKLEKEPPTERLQSAITTAQNDINKYLNKDNYDADQVAEIESIIQNHLTRIEAEVEVGDETEESADAKIAILQGIVADAKEALAQVATSQDNINEEYADFVSFESADGETKTALARKDKYGKYEITLSLFDKGGFFKVTENDADTKVSWKAEKELWYQSAGRRTEFPYIDNTLKPGMFLNQAATPQDSAPIPYEVTLETGTLKDCSVTFTKGGKEVKVVFDLNVVARKIFGISVNAPEQVVLSRDAKTLKYNTVVAPGTGDGQYLAEVASDDANYTQDVTVESLTPATAKVENNEIIPLKDGVAKFKASSEGCEDVTFEIEFLMSAEEKKEISDAAAVEKLIAKIGTVTLAKESAITAARDAYNNLSANAKKKVTAATLKTLTAAEQKLSALKTAAQKEAAAKKAAAKLAKKYTPVAPQWKSLRSKKTRTATLTWKKNSKATGYEIFMSTRKSSGYKKIATVKNWKKYSYTKKKLAKKKTYYFKLRAYKKAGGKIYRSSFSKVKKVKVK